MIEENRQVGRPKAYSNNKEMYDKIQEYFRYWEGLNRPLTVVGMACYLDICRDTLHLYSTGYYDTPNDRFSDTIKKAKMYIETTRWEGALTGKYDKTVSIFDLKVNHKAIEYEKAPLQQEVNKEEPKEGEKDIFSIDLSGLSHDELRTMANYRKIIKKAVDKE